MKVRELIESLLDYDMNADIEVQLELDDKDDWFDFDFDNNISTKEVYLTVNLSDSVLVDKDRLEELEEIANEFR